MLSFIFLKVEFNSSNELLQKMLINRLDISCGTFSEISKHLYAPRSWLTALLMFSPWMLVILKVESLDVNVRIASSVFEVMIFIIILKNKGPPRSRSGTFIMFSSTFFLSSSSQDCSKNSSDHSRFWM